MSRPRVAALLVAVFLGVASPVRAQGLLEPDKKQDVGAIYAVDYDIRDLARKPGIGPLVEAIVALEDPSATKLAMLGHDAIQILNDTRLVIRTNAAGHAEIGTVRAAFRRLADLAVILNARLYEVDEAFYKRLKSVKRMPLDELEKIFLEGKPVPDDDLYKTVGQQKLIQVGDEVKADNGQEVALLSRQNAFICLPGRAQVRRGDKSRQTILEGVAFVATIHVTADRRHVHVNLTEKATHVEEVLKVKEWDPSFRRQLDAQVPFVQESTHTRMLEIPDGGTILVPVHYRPASVEARARRWVLSIAPRIYIEEEEQEIRKGWIDLFADGLQAWKPPHGEWQRVGDVELDPQNPRKFIAKEGKGVWLNGNKSKNLYTTQIFADVDIHLEFNLPKGSNSGVKFHGHYEIQLCDSFGKKELSGEDCGGIYPRAELKPKYTHIDKGVPPKVNACKPAGQWQTLDVEFRAPRFGANGKKIKNARIAKAVLNGQVIHEDQELLTPTGDRWKSAEMFEGPLMLQGDHGPVAFRNVCVKAVAVKSEER